VLGNGGCDNQDFEKLVRNLRKPEVSAH
jgi:hypothetical protein